MEREGVKYVDLPTLLRESDFVTLHVLNRCLFTTISI
jgi:phosphoglycerate dehydrogenase-like enzyme